MRRFDDIAETAAGHFTLLTHTAVLHIVCFLEAHAALASTRPLLERYPFLRGFVTDIVAHTTADLSWEDTVGIWTSSLADWETRLPPTLPLRRLETHYGMTLSERIAVVLIGLVEEDGRFGSLYSDLQPPLAVRRPTAHLIGSIMMASGLTDDGTGITMSLIDRGVVESLDDTAPAADRALRVPPSIWRAIRDDTDPSTGQMALDEVVLPSDVIDRLRRAAVLLGEGVVRRVILRGSSGSDRGLAARAVATAAGLHPRALPLPVEPATARATGVAAVASGAALFCEIDLDLGQEGTIPDVGSAPLIFVTGNSGGFPIHVAGPTISIDIPPLNEPLRRRRWAAALDGIPLEEPDTVARDFVLPGAIIAGAAASATAEARSRQEDSIAMGLIRSELRREADRRLEVLATRVAEAGPDEELIVGTHTRAQLADLVRRCRVREQLADRLAGSSARSGVGVRALFTGASGTGKTLAARVVARALGLDVYRVDLAAVFDKYVGETEKNLHRVLAEAEQLNIVLLLDEGDSLLGSRTEVKSANDRYANLETNFLLQRLEDYQGIAFVTTNEAEHIDGAFARRMDASIPFPRPGPAERLAIWQHHLPAGHEMPPDALVAIASRHALTGGQIRNASQHAMLIAVAAGSRSPSVEELATAISIEYQKAGAMQQERGHGGAPASQRLVQMMESTQ